MVLFLGCSNVIDRYVKSQNLIIDTAYNEWIRAE